MRFIRARSLHRGISEMFLEIPGVMDAPSPPAAIKLMFLSGGLSATSCSRTEQTNRRWQIARFQRHPHPKCRLTHYAQASVLRSSESQTLRCLIWLRLARVPANCLLTSRLQSMSLPQSLRSASDPPRRIPGGRSNTYEPGCTQSKHASISSIAGRYPNGRSRDP